MAAFTAGKLAIWLMNLHLPKNDAQAAHEGLAQAPSLSRFWYACTSR